MLSGVSTTDKKTTFTTVFHGLRLTANKYVGKLFVIEVERICKIDQDFNS